MFPMDSIKTLMQVRQPHLGHAVAGGEVAGSSVLLGGSSSVMASFEHLTASGGVPRMWRGVQTMFTGCIPAHAAYFTIYEGCKASFNKSGGATPAAVGGLPSAAGEATGAGAGASGGGEGGGAPSALASGAAVAFATTAHDVIMTPMDCIKQRLQLGYYKNSIYSCACAMLEHEGPRAFVRSYPTTLMMNVPYALVMGTVNEGLRGVINPSGKGHALTTYILVRAKTCTLPFFSSPFPDHPLLLLSTRHAAHTGTVPPLPPAIRHPPPIVQAGAGAGMVAAAVTNPLDVVKTRLQTQRLSFAAGSAAESCPPAPPNVHAQVNKLPCGVQVAECPRTPLPYTGFMQAARALWREEGAACFARGMQARVMIHAPSVAICWTTYESVKHMLVRLKIFD
jgi:solute carrier family 25 iron transporter 28/37